MTTTTRLPQTSELLSEAIALAAEIHAGTIDKGGVAYILHPLRVMHDAMDKATEDKIAVGIAAILHDVIEDNRKYTKTFLFSMMEDQGFETYIPIIKLLTKEAEYFEYIEGIENACASNDSDQQFYGYIARQVKLADLRDNLRIDRQPSMDDKDMHRIQKYHLAYRKLHSAY